MAKPSEKNYPVEIRNKAKKNLKKIPFPWKQRIRRAIDRLEEDRFYGVKMKGEYAGSYKIIIWPYRILYVIKEEEKLAYVWQIQHRGSVGYKMFV